MARPRNILDYKNVQSVSVAVLQDSTTGEIAGKIISNWTSNTSYTCTSQVFIYNPGAYGLTSLDSPAIGRASGGGYDKLSAAIYAAMRKGFDIQGKAFDGCGESAVIEYFARIGITYTSLC